MATLFVTIAAVLLGAAGASAAWAPGPSMVERTTDAAATRLGDGTVLVIGGSTTPRPSFAPNQRFDPATGRWSVTGDLLVPRTDLSLVTLLDGSGLAVGGAVNANFANAERYDPATGTFSAAGDHRSAGGTYPGVAVLLDGRVLGVGGGYYDTSSNSTSLYDPATNAWERRASYPIFVNYHAVARLLDGRVLVAGGYIGLGDFGSPPTELAYLYDPATDTWSPAASLPAARVGAAAVTLNDGRVLLSGGYPGDTALLYDAAANRWTPTRSLPAGAVPSRLVLLPDGRVLGIGGVDAATGTTAAALFDPATNGWSNAGPLLALRAERSFTATLLADGRVLVAGGHNSAQGDLASTELWTPGGTQPPARCTPHPSRGKGKAKGRHKHGHVCKGRRLR